MERRGAFIRAIVSAIPVYLAMFILFIGREDSYGVAFTGMYLILGLIVYSICYLIYVIILAKFYRYDKRRKDIVINGFVGYLVILSIGYLVGMSMI